MKYQIKNSELFVLNRKKFSSKLRNNSLSIINANDEFPRSGDQIYNFKQNCDLFYLTGIDQEQTILLLFPNCPNPQYKEVLFLRQTNEHIAIWEGEKLLYCFNDLCVLVSNPSASDRYSSGWLSDRSCNHNYIKCFEYLKNQRQLP